MNDQTAAPEAAAPTLRPGLPPLPPRIAQLPIGAGGYPIPWFVATVNGKPDARIADPDKLVLAIQKGLCWVCGQPLGKWAAFVIGPMCAVNRTSAEPPSHRECAEFSAMACPFLTKPNMVRRDEQPAGSVPAAGNMILRNPGCIAVWVYEGRYVVNVTRGGVLITIPKPTEVHWYAEGRKATRKEVLAAVNSGLELIEPAKTLPNKENRVAFLRLLKLARTYFPAE